MGAAAGLLNRRVVFRRRSLLPTAPLALRGGYVALGSPQWAGFKPARSTTLTIGGLELEADAGVVTVRDNPFTRDVTMRDQVEVDGTVYEVTGRQIGEMPDGTIRFDVREAPTHAMYARAADSKGEVVVLRRVVNGGGTQDAQARAIITGYQPEELVGGITAGERRIYLLAQDLVGTVFETVPPQALNRILIRGGTRNLNIVAVDDSTHRYAGELHAYDIRASG